MTAPAVDLMGWDSPTAPCADQSGPQAGERPAQGEATGALLVLTLNGEIVATLLEPAGPVLVGRSSRCGLRCEDPAFPGVAGEVILHPLPLFRVMGGNLEKADPEGISVKHLTPGVPLPLGPYRLWLLPPGFSLKNRKRAKRRFPRLARLLLFTFLLLPVAAGAVVLWERKDAVAPAAAATPSAAAAMPETAPALPVAARPPSAVAVTPVPSPLPAPSAGGAPGDSSRATLEPPTPGVSSETMKAALDLARNAFLAGDPVRAGAALRPFLPLMSSAQLAAAMSTLEPLAYPFFRKAYMELPYQPTESRATLALLAECGLPGLPSVQKARCLAPGKPITPRTVNRLPSEDTASQGGTLR